MGRLPTLTKNYEYQRVYGRGKYASSRTLVVYVMPNRTGQRRVGITTSRKVGKSVVRNRMRRLIRENMRSLFPSLPTGRDIVIVARKADNKAGCASVGKELRYLFGRLGLLPQMGDKPAPDMQAETGRKPEAATQHVQGEPSSSASGMSVADHGDTPPASRGVNVCLPVEGCPE